jgi:hypothetical protein
MELPEKIEKNLVAYLQSLTTWPAYFDGATMIAPGESDADKRTQVIQCVCDDADSEDPAYSGNYWHPLKIELRTPATLLTDEETESSDASVSTSQLDKHKAVAAALSDAINITDLMDQLNATAQAQTDTELKAFAAIGFMDRKPMREQPGDFYASGFTLRRYSNSSASAA